MSDLKLVTAREIIDGALKKARELDIKPLGVVVLDARGCLKAFEAEDGTSLIRFEIAFGKAYGALGMGMGSRALAKRAQDVPHFVTALAALTDGKLVPVPGGVLALDIDGKLMGAVGISGDTSDNDEACAIAGLQAAGLRAVVD